MSAPLRRIHAACTAICLLVTVMTASILASRSVAAEPPPRRLPREPWEQEVEQGIAAQTSLIEQAKLTKTVASVVSRYENRVFRDPSPLNEFLLGRVLYYAGNPTAAKAAMERCLAANPAFHYARSRLAILLLELKNLGDAEVHLRKVLESRPGQPEALELLARIAVERKDWKAAVGWLNQRLSADPTDVGARQNIAFVWLQLKDWPAAKREIGLLVDRDPANLAYRYMLAVVRLEMGEIDAGIAGLEAVVHEQPGNVEALAQLHRAYVEKANWPRVRSTLERMLPYLNEEARKKAVADIESLKKGPPPVGEKPAPRELTWDDILRAVEDPNPARREDALIAVYDACKSGELKQVPQRVLRRITSDVEPSHTARSFVVRIVGTLAPEQVMPLLAIALYDESEPVRMLAAEAIGASKKPVGLAYLFPMLSSETVSPSEYQSIRAALTEITGYHDLPEGLSSVTTPADAAASREAWRRWRLSDGSDDIKRAAVKQLVEYKEQSSERFLYDFVLDPSFLVMSDAYIAMRNAVARPPRDPVERKVFPLFPAASDAEITRASMRPLQDRVVDWWKTFVAERRAYIQAKQPTLPLPPK